MKPPGDLPVEPDIPASLTVRERLEDSVDIPLRATVTVTGLFLERGTGKPVPGVGWVFTPRTPVRGPKSREAVKDRSARAPGRAATVLTMSCASSGSDNA